MEYENIPRLSLSWMLAALSIVVTCYILVQRYKFRKLPPGPRGLPLVGYLPFLGSNPAAKYASLAKTYGPIISVNIGPKTVVVLNDYESIQEALVKNGHAFSGRHQSQLLLELSQGRGIIIHDYGGEYKSQRKFAMMTLRGFGVGKRSMEDRIIEEVGYLLEVINGKDGRPFDCQQDIVNAVSNVICNIVLGSRFSYDDKVFLEMQKCLNRPIGEDAPYFAILVLACSLRKFPPFSGAYKRIADDYRYVGEKLTEIVEEHKKTLDVKNVRDFTDEYLKEMDIRGGDDPSFNDLQLINTIRDMFLAGMETTSSTLRWCVLSFATYPNMQEKVAKEIRDVIGAGIPQMQHRAQMPYTCAFLQEIMRHRTLVPLSVPHKTSSAVRIRGFDIPKDTPVLPNIWAVHHDPKYFLDPEVFRPERFLDSEGRFLEDKHVIPFSVGPRYCPGEQLAKMELFLFFTSIAQRFKVLRVADKSLPDFHGGTRGVATGPPPFEVRFQQR